MTMGKINLGKVALTFKRGGWKANIEYERLDTVSYDGCAWAALKKNKGVKPAAGSSTWELLAEKGDSAYEVARQNGFTGDEKAWLEFLRKGPKGDPGEKGDPGDLGLLVVNDGTLFFVDVEPRVADGILFLNL